MTDRGGGASLLPCMPAGVIRSDDDDDSVSLLVMLFWAFTCFRSSDRVLPDQNAFHGSPTTGDDTLPAIRSVS